MEICPRPIPGLDSPEGRRFRALRQRIFDEMGRSAARWRLTWLLPFYVFVFALLAIRGESAPRAIIQAISLVIIGTLFVARIFYDHVALKVSSFIAGLCTYFVLLSTTGGLASPLLVSGALMMTAAAITLREPHWLRSVVFMIFLGGYVALALTSQLSIGQLSGPLAPVGIWPSPEYVSITLVASFFTMVGVYRMGCAMTYGYERAAFELAERREELCSENEDRGRALEGMAARLAHEVKNPLAAIKGLSTHMARNATDAKTAERLAIVAAEADRLQSVVEGFLSFSRGLEDLNPAPTQLHEVARELCVLLETRAQDAGVSLSVSGDVAVSVDADARKLRQALLNLVLNAIQASPRGATVAIKVAQSSCGGARIVVQDDGAGMTPEVIERIRKPYFTTKEGGTGLGVAVARGVIDQHGGQIEYKSVSGKGTSVTVRLPARANECAKLPYPIRGPKPDGAPAESTPDLGAHGRALTS
ncbi:MAG TPA: HAMP domain-containing sensor histidine kinase [Polyangiaceae bacterium]|jgi:signal transduction histidine kinase|nr:HAMP domain-containing sensor histidine kinase [Polyangiaceae bacterium]